MRAGSGMRGTRLVGVPFLFAIAASAVGFSIYFSIGVVADRGLGLTPLIFLAAGLLFAMTTLTYVEGGAMFRERGGSSTFARHAFNELISFIAGWAILIDYVIVIAAAAISVPHYLTPIWREPRGRSRRSSAVAGRGDPPRGLAQRRRGDGGKPAGRLLAARLRRPRAAGCS